MRYEVKWHGWWGRSSRPDRAEVGKEGRLGGSSGSDRLATFVLHFATARIQQVDGQSSKQTLSLGKVSAIKSTTFPADE